MRIAYAGFILYLTIAQFIFAQVPEKMSYQAIIRDNNNNLVRNKEIGIQISVMRGNPPTEVIFQERHYPYTDQNGLISIEIGTGSILTGNFESIIWGDGPYFIKSECDPTGATNYTITGISQILSVPYALYAKSSGNGFSGNYNDLANKPEIWDSTYNSIKGRPDLTVYATKNMAGQRIINLAEPVNDQDAATKVYVDAIKEEIYNEFLEAGLNSIVKDIDGNTYKTLKIGSQVWMVENLKTTRLNDGSSVQNVNSNNSWASLITPAYCWYNNESSNKNIYGALYNWYTVGTDKICPMGWHVPTDSEWQILIDDLGGNSIAGGKLKASGTTYWTSPNFGANNESGFNGLPGGYRVNDGTFLNIKNNGQWWSATDNGPSVAWSHYLFYNDGSVTHYYYDKGNGYSVRCIKD